MTDENAFERGTSTPQGKDASTRKNNAPVSLTVRRTSDSGSRLLTAHAADDAEASAGRSARHIVDDAASDKDDWSWAWTMPEHTLCGPVYPPHVPEARIKVETRS